MGKLVYVPDLISNKELESSLHELKELFLQVDHDVSRNVINEALSELYNEVDNIEKGYRHPSHLG